MRWSFLGGVFLSKVLRDILVCSRVPLSYYQIVDLESSSFSSLLVKVFWSATFFEVGFSLFGISSHNTPILPCSDCYNITIDLAVV